VTYPSQGYTGQPGFPMQNQPQPQYVAQVQGWNPAYPQQQPAQPPVQLAPGSVEGFFSQPSVGGGPALFGQTAQGQPAPIGTEYFGVIARDIKDSDIEQQTDYNDKSKGATFKNGQPKFVMKVPLLLPISQTFPEGTGQWYVQGAVRDELVRALAMVGAPTGAPQGGWGVHVKKIGERPIRGLRPASVYQVTAFPPEVAAGYAAQMGIAGTPVQSAPAPAPMQAPAPAQPQATFPAPNPTPAQENGAPEAMPAVSMSTPMASSAPVPPAAPVAPEGLNAAQAALFATMTGQAQ